MKMNRLFLLTHFLGLTASLACNLCIGNFWRNSLMRRRPTDPSLFSRCPSIPLVRRLQQCGRLQALRTIPNVPMLVSDKQPSDTPSTSPYRKLWPSGGVQSGAVGATPWKSRNLGALLYVRSTLLSPSPCGRPRPAYTSLTDRALRVLARWTLKSRQALRLLRSDDECRWTSQRGWSPGMLKSGLRLNDLNGMHLRQLRLLGPYFAMALMENML